jgi:hypothetical protein
LSEKLVNLKFELHVQWHPYEILIRFI